MVSLHPRKSANPIRSCETNENACHKICTVVATSSVELHIAPTYKEICYLEKDAYCKILCNYSKYYCPEETALNPESAGLSTCGQHCVRHIDQYLIINNNNI